MLKHWAVCHNDQETPPEFRFRVVKCHSDPLSRMLHEAVRILKCATMNSKTELKGYKIARIVVEPLQWQAKKDLELAEKLDKIEEGKMLCLREKMLDHPFFSNSNNNSSSRKRKQEMSVSQADVISPINKRVKQAHSDTTKLNAVATKHGKWNSDKSEVAGKSAKVKCTKPSVLTWIKSRSDGLKSSTPKKVEGERVMPVSDSVPVTSAQLNATTLENSRCLVSPSTDKSLSDASLETQGCVFNPSASTTPDALLVKDSLCLPTTSSAPTSKAVSLVSDLCLVTTSTAPTSRAESSDSCADKSAVNALEKPASDMKIETCEESLKFENESNSSSFLAIVNGDNEKSSSSSASTIGTFESTTSSYLLNVESFSVSPYKEFIGKSVRLPVVCNAEWRVTKKLIVRELCEPALLHPATGCTENLSAIVDKNLSVIPQENLSASGAASHGSQVQISNCNSSCSVMSLSSNALAVPSNSTGANKVSEPLPSQLPMTYWDHLIAVKDASFVGSGSARKRLWDKELMGRLTSSLASCALSTPNQGLEARLKKLKVGSCEGDGLDAVATSKQDSSDAKLHSFGSSSTGNGEGSSQVDPKLSPAQPGIAGSPA